MDNSIAVFYSNHPKGILKQLSVRTKLFSLRALLKRPLIYFAFIIKSKKCLKYKQKSVTKVKRKHDTYGIVKFSLAQTKHYLEKSRGHLL